MVWALWWEQNKRIFYQNPSSIENVLSTIKKSILEVVNANHSKLKCNPVLSSWDSVIIHEWKGMHVPIGWCQQSRATPSQGRDKVLWVPPDSRHVKLNFDGSSWGNPGKLGARVSIRDHQGEVLALKSTPLPLGSNNMAEAHALFSGLVLEKQGGFRNIQVKGDSVVIINACIKRESHNWKLAYIYNKFGTS